MLWPKCAEFLSIFWKFLRIFDESLFAQNFCILLLAVSDWFSILLALRYQCEFHITQEDLCDDHFGPDETDGEYDEEAAQLDQEQEESNAHTLMSVHLDTFLEKRYPEIKETVKELPRVARWVFNFYVDVFTIGYNCAMFWYKNGRDFINDAFENARVIQKGAGMAWKQNLVLPETNMGKSLFVYNCP